MRKRKAPLEEVDYESLKKDDIILATMGHYTQYQIPAKVLEVQTFERDGRKHTNVFYREVFTGYVGKQQAHDNKCTYQRLYVADKNSLDGVIAKFEREIATRQKKIDLLNLCKTGRINIEERKPTRKELKLLKEEEKRKAFKEEDFFKGFI